MKYLEFIFHTTPCTETVNDVLSAVLGEVGFESFVEQPDGIAAYIQKDLYNESSLKEAIADSLFPTHKWNIPTGKQKIKTGMKNGKRISSNPLSLAIAASFIAHSTMTSRKLTTTSSSILKWHSVQATTKPPASSSVNCWTTTFKASPYSIWAAAHLSSPYWHACVVLLPAQLST